jgi:predicted lipoprotein with Yx(FWY)xxD motif
MRTGLRTAALGAVSAALVAGSWLGASAAFGAAHTPKDAVIFRAEHIAGVKGNVLVEGSGLVVYTFTGDTPGKAGTCTGACEAVWPQVRGVPVVASGTKIGGKFGRIDGQVTYNGWPLYLFTGEKWHQNHADSHFKVVQPTPWHASAPMPGPTPKPTPTYAPTPMPTNTYSYGYGM